MFFKPQLPDEAFQNWCKEAIDLLFTTLDAKDPKKIPQVILPTDEFYPFQLNSPTYFTDLFEATKTYMGMTEWECELRLYNDEEFERHSKMGLDFQSSTPAGFIYTEGDKIIISIKKSNHESPYEFIATSAHELSHYLLHTIEGHDKWGPDVEEFLTDLCVIYQGFGIFQFKSVLSTHHEGGVFGMSSTSRQGYMNRLQILYSMSLIYSISGQDITLFKKHLGPDYRTLKKMVTLHAQMKC